MENMKKSMIAAFLAFLVLIGFHTVSFAASGDDEDTFTITLGADPAEGGTFTGQGTYNKGKNVLISAKPNEGFTFVGWYRSGGDELVSEEPEFEYDLEQTRTFVARFEKMLTVNMIAEPAVGGTVTQTNPSGGYALNDAVTITATSNDGYSFIGWFDASSPVEPLTTDSVYTFDITQPMSFIARFAAQYQLDVNVSPEGGGNVLGSGQYAGGSIVMLEAMPAEDYRFVGWVSPAEPNKVISTDPKYTFNLDSDLTLTAKFARSYAYYGSRIAIIAVIGVGAVIGGLYLYRYFGTVRRGGGKYGRGRRPGGYSKK